jgi:integrase
MVGDCDRDPREQRKRYAHVARAETETATTKANARRTPGVAGFGVVMEPRLENIVARANRTLIPHRNTTPTLDPSWIAVGPLSGACVDSARSRLVLSAPARERSIDLDLSEVTRHFGAERADLALEWRWFDRDRYDPLISGKYTLEPHKADLSETFLLHTAVGVRVPLPVVAMLMGRGVTIAALAGLGIHLPSSVGSVAQSTPTPKCERLPLTRGLFDDWREAMSGECRAKWWMTRGYHFDHIARHFGTLDAILDASMRRQYVASALKRCGAETLKKELGTLRSFAAWAEGQAWGFVAPEVSGPTKKQRGTRDPRRKREPISLQADEVEALIAQLPEQTSRARRAGDPLRPIRDFVVMVWDTGLRPSTVERLSTPEHWRRGSKELFITAGIDKEEYERTVDITDRVADVLERRTETLRDGRGVLFGPCQSALKGYLPIAAAAAGIDEARARKTTIYDFRHAAGRRLLDASGGNMRGVAFQLGHRRPTTTNIYTRPDKHAGDAVVAALATSQASEPPRLPAACADGVDEAQAPDYEGNPTREGGGIGRRTSLRC